MKKLVLAAALALCAAVPAAAQQEPSAGEMQAVREMLDAMRVREMLPRTMETMLSGALGEEMPEEFLDIMREFFAEHLRYEDLEAGFARAYTDLFTEEEMRALTAFYRTPAGQRFVELTPELSGRIQQMTVEVMEDSLPELERMIQERLELEEGGRTPKAPRTGVKS